MNPAGTSPADSASLLTKSDWRGTFFRRARRVAIAALCVAVMAQAYFLFVHPQYRASALLRIQAQRPTVTGLTNDDELTGERLERFMRTQINMLRSPIVLDRVLSDPQIARLPELREQRSPLEWLQRQLDVESIENSELFRVSFAGPDPKNAADITNAVLDSYIKIQGDLESQQAQQVINLLDKEMDRRAHELERLRQSVRTLDQMSGEAAVALERATHPDAPRPPSALDRLATEIEDNQRDADWLELRREAYAARLAALAPDDAAAREKLQSSLTEIEIEKNARGAYLARLEARRKEIEAEAAKNANHALDLVFLQQDLQRSEEIYQQIADRAEKLKTDMRSPERVCEMRRASIPVERELPWWIRWSLLAWSS